MSCPWGGRSRPSSCLLFLEAFSQPIEVNQEETTDNPKWKLCSTVSKLNSNQIGQKCFLWGLVLPPGVLSEFSHLIDRQGMINMIVGIEFASFKDYFDIVGIFFRFNKFQLFFFTINSKV